MEEVKIKIKDVEYTLKESTRSLLKFEELTKKSVGELNTTFTDNVTLLYCMLFGSNRNTFKYTYDEFIDVLDEGDTLEMFNEFLTSQKKENKKKVMKKV